MKTLLTAGAAIVAVVGLADLAFGQQQSMCAPTVQLIEHLSVSFGETPRVIVQTDGEQPRQLVLFSNPETRTWTAVVFQGRQGCLVMSGTDWEEVEHQAPKPPEKGA